MEYTTLEREVLNWMASHTSIPNLKQQITAAQPIERELTGVGSYTKLTVPSATQPMNTSGIQIPIVGPWIADAPGIKDDGGSLLFISEAGYVDTLEIYAIGDSFDESTTVFRLHDKIEPDGATNSLPRRLFSNPAPWPHAQSRILLWQAARLRFLALLSHAVSGRLWQT